MKNIKNPYQAGYDAGFNKPDEDNCNYYWFSSPEDTKEWERGNKDGKKNKSKIN